MRKYFDKWTLAGAAVVFLIWLAAVPSSTIAAIIQAVIPAVVPTANKTGNSSKFQLASGSVTAGHCGQYDASGNLVDAGITCNGVGSGTPGATVFSSTTSAGPNDTAVETSLIGTVVGSTSIAANTFTDGAVLEARTQGFFSLPATADSLTLKAKCGSTVIGSAAATLPAGVVTNGTFRFWLMITAQGSGAGGVFMTNGVAEFTGAALAPSIVKVLNTSTVAFDFTGSCAFDMTATWGAAQVGELITATNAAAWFPGAPVTSVGGATGAVKSGFQGNGTLIQLSTGSTTTNNCVKFDANGNTVDAGAACGTGSGASITQGTFASLPGTCTTNDLYFMTDSVYTARCSASNTWSLFYQGAMLVTAPPSAGWTGDNTAASAGTQSSTQGYLYSTFTAASAVNARFFYRTAPATPYSVTALIKFDLAAGTTGGNEIGPLFGFRDSAGKMVVWMLQKSAGIAKFGDAKWTSTTSFSAYYASDAQAAAGNSMLYGPNPLWLRIRDCGAASTGNCTGLANKIQFSYSFDGQNFIQFDAQTRTDFMLSGADAYGYGAYINDAPVNVFIYSLAEGT